MCPPPPPPHDASASCADISAGDEAAPLHGLTVEELDDDAYDTFFGTWVD